MVRAEAAQGNVPTPLLGEAQRRLHGLYASFAGALPEIARLMGNLGELTSAEPSTLFRSERFQADLAFARANVAQRIAERKRQAAMLRAASPQPATV
jgi:hypothetical protein